MDWIFFFIFVCTNNTKTGTGIRTTDTMELLTQHTWTLRNSIGVTVDFEINTRGEFDHISFTSHVEDNMEIEEFEEWCIELRQEYEYLLNYLVESKTIMVEFDYEYEEMKMVTIGSIEVLQSGFILQYEYETKEQGWLTHKSVHEHRNLPWFK